MNWRRVIVSGFALLVASAATAGQRCVPMVDIAMLEKAVSLGRLAAAELDRLDDPVVLVARIGQDLSDYGLSWSHAGFAVRDHPNGRWTVVHELNECGTDRSSIYAQGLGNFYADDLFRYRGAAQRLPPAVAARLHTLLNTDAVLDTHGSVYRMTAYPFSPMYQNSNGWVIETLARAMAPAGEVGTREQAQAWLQTAGYTPTTLDIGWLKRLGGRLVKSTISFDDHPPELRWQGRIQVVTVDSIFDFVQTRIDAAEGAPPLLEFELPQP